MSSTTATAPSVRTITLNDGHAAPAIAFGTGTSHAWKDSTEATLAALNAGYTHLDCAYHYKNQKFTGEAIRQSSIPREQLFISTKAGSFDDAPETFDARDYLESNLADLGVDYVDLYLIHADFLVSDIPKAWSQMEACQAAGLCRSIGVSNFSTRSLETLLESCTVKPAVNQVECHPNALPTYMPTLVPLCAEHGIKIASYGPLVPVVRRPSESVLLVAAQVATERTLGETEGQVVLQWNQQATGGIVVTTSSKPERMAEQIKPFLTASAHPPLSDAHMSLIKAAGEADKYRHWGVSWPNFMNGEGGIQYEVADRGTYGTQKSAQEKAAEASGAATAESAE